MNRGEIKKLPRWYMGGVASCATAMLTHPLDLIKVHLQTHQHSQKKSILLVIADILKHEGCLSLYYGLSATMVNQLMYGPTRFIIYEELKERIDDDFLPYRIMMTAVAGAAAGLAGTPTDVVTVRMQHDAKLPEEERRNYKDVFHALIIIIQDEGVRSLFHGTTGAIGRGVVMSIGQMAFYDQVKILLLSTPIFKDDLLTHFIAGSIAGVTATILTNPVDVVKTRMMNAEPGVYKGFFHCFFVTRKEGFLAFYKGLLPSSVRVVINTIVIFLIFEQLRLNFGIDRTESTSAPSMVTATKDPLTVSTTVSTTNALVTD